MMQDKNIILVAKCFDSSTSGPANIVRNLIKYFKLNNIDVEEILLTEKVSKLFFLKQVFTRCLISNGSIINTHTDGFLVPLLVMIVSIFNKKNSYYLTVHGIYVFDNGNNTIKKKIYCFLEGLLYKNFPNIICVSEMLAKDIKSLFGRKKPIRVIPNATDASSEKIPQNYERLRIILLGGLKQNKGIEESLDLLESVKHNGINFKANIYGSDEERLEWFNDQLSNKGLMNYVEFHGLMEDRKRIYDLIAESDVQLCLSKYDTFNVAIAESLVLGCPVIASDRCGAACLIEGDSGKVLSIEKERENNYKEACAYIKKLQNTKFRRNVYERRKEYIDKLSWNRVVCEYASL